MTNGIDDRATRASGDLDDFRRATRALLATELAPHVDELEEAGEFCRPAYERLGGAGLAAPMLPQPYGRNSLMAQVIVAEEMGYVACGFGFSVLASVCLFGANLGRQGNAAQAARYLPGIASGRKIGCWALTEPAVGSDAVSIEASCRRDGDHYVLNGTKSLITNAPIADYFIVIMRDHGPDGRPVEGFGAATAFVLERGMPGLTTSKPHRKLGQLSSPNGDIVMENVRVPAAQVLGEPGQAFLGMKVALDIERVIFGAPGVGMMRFLLETVVRYASQRKQFGVPIIEHQLIQEKVAEIAAQLEVNRTFLYAVTRKLEAGGYVTKEAAIFKLLGARAAVQTASEAIQCLGGYGYLRDFKVERCLRDAKLFEIGGGTSEMQKLIIAKRAIREVMKDSAG